MELEEAIRSRRTHKAFAPEPVARELLDELLELARWAPNHHLTNPWRFRVLGPESLRALKQAAGPEAAAKLDRAPTLVAATAVRSETRSRMRRTCGHGERHVRAAARGPCARAGGLLAHAGRAAQPRGRRPSGSGGRAFVALIHLGRPRQDKDPPERAPVAEIWSI